jgi:hypothetical protein
LSRPELVGKAFIHDGDERCPRPIALVERTAANGRIVPTGIVSAGYFKTVGIPVVR